MASFSLGATVNKSWESRIPARYKMATSQGAVLSDKQAIEIYRCKLRLRTPDSFKSSLQSVEARSKGQSAQIASRFGVSPKTIRDIWNRRTWVHTTEHMWCEEEDAEASIFSVTILCLQVIPFNSACVIQTLINF
jgi:hypothetical protein